MDKKYLALILILICTFLTALGQIFWKIGADKLIFNLNAIYNYNIWAGFVLYGIGALLLIYSLKYGNLSFVHPFLSLGFVWASIFAFFYLKESFPPLKVSAIAIIIAGSFLIFKGDVK